MRFLKLWMPAFAGLFLFQSAAFALPIPKLPPEATDKPSVVVRVRPLGELLKDVQYVAKLVGQEEVFNAFEPGIQPVLDCIDTTRPLGGYAKVGQQGIDSVGIVMIPVKNIKDFVGLLNQLGQNPTEGEDGLYRLNIPGAPFAGAFRFHNGYVYATVKNTPDAEASLAANKLFAPAAIFKDGDNSVVSITFNVDAIPNALKTKGLEGLEEVLRQFRANELPKQQNPVIKAFLDTAAEEVATKVQSFIVDTQSTTFRFDLDRAKEDLAVSFKLTPRPATPLAKDLETTGGGMSLGAGVFNPASPISVAVNIAVPGSLKKALDPLIDQLLAEGWKKANAKEQPLVKELLEIVAPTLRAGIFDFGAEIRGPDSENHAAVLVVLGVKDGDKLEAFARKIHGMLPDGDKAGVKLDVDKAGTIAIHQGPLQLGGKGIDMVGANAVTLFAFRKDAIVLAVGPQSEATAAVKGALSATAKTADVMKGQALMRKLAPLVERNDPGAVEAAKKAYPAGISDAYTLSVTGGSSLDIRFAASSRIIQFSYLLEQARRNR